MVVPVVMPGVFKLVLAVVLAVVLAPVLATALGVEVEANSELNSGRVNQIFDEEERASVIEEERVSVIAQTVERPSTRLTLFPDSVWNKGKRLIEKSSASEAMKWETR